MHIASAVLVVAITACGSAPPKTRVTLVEAQPSIEAAPAPRILVTTDHVCHNPDGGGCDILAVLDLHTTASSQDKGFEELRAKADELGGNAVVAAEFEHGAQHEPSHLSGVVVRYAKPFPRHVDVGVIDIPSDPNSEDKGLVELTKRARAMGGDRVIGVTFEHGDNGAQGHLRGRVVRYTP